MPLLDNPTLFLLIKSTTLFIPKKSYFTHNAFKVESQDYEQTSQFVRMQTLYWGGEELNLTKSTLDLQWAYL